MTDNDTVITIELIRAAADITKRSLNTSTVRTDIEEAAQRFLMGLFADGSAKRIKVVKCDTTER